MLVLERIYNQRSCRENITILNYKGNILWDKSKPNGTPRKLLNSDRLNSLGWLPKISLEEGLKETINSYQELAASNNLRGINNL